MIKKDIMIKSFPAAAGDCFIIEFEKEDYCILLDGGYVGTYNKYLRNYLLELASRGKHINLLIITHIDSDHIGGIQALLAENGSANDPSIIHIDEVWYNAFSHMYGEERIKKKIPYTTKEVLRGILLDDHGKKQAQNGNVNISVSQGNTVVKLLLDNGYNWNAMWSGKAVCVENGVHIKLNEKIQCTLFNPGIKELRDLAKLWISKMKNTVRNFEVSEDNIFEEAFEKHMLHRNDEHIVIVKDIALEDTTDEQCIAWENWIDAWSGQVDNSETNRSSIAFMLEYEGVKMLFPGDAPLQLFQEKLPKEIDIVKLPHHGSEYNISADFINDTKVTAYILSTDGKRHEHPSKTVIANIIYKAPGKPNLYKNYDISYLRNHGVVWGYKNE